MSCTSATAFRRECGPTRGCVYGRTVKALTLVRTAAVIRIGIGTTLAIGTGRVLRGMLRDEKPSASSVLIARTVGIRDALFGLGCLLSTLEPSRAGETRRWVQLWLANKVAAAPLPLIAVDVWTLRHLPAVPAVAAAGSA